MSCLQVIIVNYRTCGLVLDCLRSLAAEAAGLDCRVAIVDNASGDNSAEELRQAVRRQGWDWAEVVALGANRGFGAGNNAALQAALAGPRPPDYVLLLNPDTIVRPGAMRALLDFASRHPRAGVFGPRLENPDSTPQRSAFRFPSVLGEIEGSLRLGLATRLLQRHMVAPPARPEAHLTDWVSGAAMLIRREVFEQIGLLDEGYFLYFEETDLCRRAAAAGWECWYVPASRIVHLVGQSTGLTGDRRMPAYWLESRRRYFEKHHGRAYAWTANLAWSAAFAAWRLRRRIQRKPDLDPPHLLGDFVRFNFLGRRASVA